MSRMGEVYDPAFPTADDDDILLKDNHPEDNSLQPLEDSLAVVTSSAETDHSASENTESKHPSSSPRSDPKSPVEEVPVSPSPSSSPSNMRKTRRNSTKDAAADCTPDKPTKAPASKATKAIKNSVNNVKSRSTKANNNLAKEAALKEELPEVQKPSKKSVRNKAVEKEQEESPPSPEQNNTEEMVVEENSVNDSGKEEEPASTETNHTQEEPAVAAADMPKKKGRPLKVEEETKVPTRRSTRIKLKEVKKETPPPKKSTKKKEKEPIADDIPKEQTKKDSPKKVEKEDQNKPKEDKESEEEDEKPQPEEVKEEEPEVVKEEEKEVPVEEEKIPLINNHTEEEEAPVEVKEEETAGSPKDEVVKEMDVDQGSPPVPEPEPMEIDPKELKLIEASEIQEAGGEEEAKESSPAPAVDLPAPSSPQTEEPTEAAQQNTKPVKVKSRWWRNSEMEQSDTSAVTTPDQTDMLSPPPKETPPPPSSPTFNYGRPPKDIGKDFPYYEHIDENICLFERKRSKGKKEVRRMLCDCSFTKEEKERRELGCGDDCINRLLMIECGSRCATGELCSNKRFQMKKYAPLEPFKTNKKGWGLRAKESIQAGQFVIEYVGEVVDPPEFRRRVKDYSKEHQSHHYFMALKSDEIIDATNRGNLSRFINHSCDPNCETQKWTVNGELRIGFFTTRRVPSGEELTFDYQFQRYGREAQRCFCEASCCRGYIGLESQVDLKSYKSSKELKKKKDKKDPEDPILEEEIERLSGGLRTREQTLTLARLMVRAEEDEIRRRLLDILRNTPEPACLRLFLDYHGLSLLWSWMVAGCPGLELRAKLLEILKILPVPHKTMLIDSRVMDVVQRWARPSPSDLPPDCPSSRIDDIAATASSLLASWVDLKEIFRIPRLEKQKRREEEKELDRRTREYNRKRRSHSRERDRDRRRSYSPMVHDSRYRRDRRDYDHRGEYSEWRSSSPRKHKPSSGSSGYKRSRDSRLDDEEVSIPKKECRKSVEPQLSKEERRHRFAMEVQQKDEEEAALRKNKEEFPQPDFAPPPTFQQQQQQQQQPGMLPVPQQDQQPLFPFPPPLFDPTMPPPVPPGQYLPPQVENQASIPLVPPPTVPPTNMPPPTFSVPPPFMEPRPPGGVFFSQPPTAPPTLPPPPQQVQQVSTLMPSPVPPQSPYPSPSPSPFPGQSSYYLIPPTPELRLSVPYTGKLPPHWKRAKDDEGNTYYYHTLTRQAQWEVPEWDPDDISAVDEPRPSSRKQRSTTTAAADTSSEVAKKIKELFRTKMSSHIVQCLNPFRKLDCKVGRITSTDDFKHLARKLTHFVMAKELKHCKAVEDLECNDNVKHKAKDFVHKYMAKYGTVYRKEKSPPQDD